MYENLFSYNKMINGKSVRILIKPNFREEITLYNGNNAIMSDGKVMMTGELLLDAGHSEFPDVYVSEDAQWALEDKGDLYTIFITERTKEITTPLGPKWNQEFNRLLKKCKSEYYQQKKKEVRLYFYEVASETLYLCYLDSGYVHECDSYSLTRCFPTIPYCKIDKRYAKPNKDCFILGRVRKTIGLKKSKLLDFIEPVHQISLDFEKDKYDFGDYEYEKNKEHLKKKLFELLKFSIAKKHNPLSIIRIRTYFQNNSDEQDIVISQFKNEIQKFFKEDNVQEIRHLYDVLKKPQDCTNVKFGLRLKEEVTCWASGKLDVLFVNGEYDYVDAKWIYENIHNCIDACGEYLEHENMYKFY